MKCQCEGYCGGIIERGEARITPDGYRMCPDCWRRAMNNQNPRFE
jgi:hypothetical protein